MGEASWPNRPPPDLTSDPSSASTWEPETPIDLVVLRRRLRSAVAAGWAPPDTVADDAECLLLTVEELASNALRHGRPPIRVVVTLTGTGWLVDVSDAAPDRPPAPAVGRDAAFGGLGLYLVDRLCACHGWQVETGRKRVWAQLVCGAAPHSDGVAPTAA